MVRAKVIVAGAGGRMGQAILRALWQHPNIDLAGALDTPNNPLQGHDVGVTHGEKWGVTLSSDVAQTLAAGNCLIDFTRPAGTMVHLQKCSEHKISMVIGTTGLDEAQFQQLQDATKKIAVVYAPNMGLGVNVLFRLVAQAAQMLKHGFDVEIIEAHHRLKVDAPSGTALKLGEIVASAREQDLSATAMYSRHGTIGERRAETIGFSVIRGGDIVGDHTVMFAGLGERIEITHRATDRTPYALGALRAAQFIIGRPPGLYSMSDVLGLG